jgi:hypothetical protein
MTKIPLSYKGRLQKGWALLEAAAVTALLGLMLVAVWTTMQAVQHRTTAAANSGQLSAGRAETALYGDALVHFHFPAPDDAVTPSPGRPGYMEGWLPRGLLAGGSTAPRVRYLVHASLVNRPSTIYLADPLQLAGGLIPARPPADINVNGLDFCLVLIQQEQAGAALPGGMRLAFALQEVTPQSRAVPQIWVGGGDSGTPPADTTLETRTSGFLELTAKLGCFDKLSRISAEVKSAAVLADLIKLATLNVDYKALGVKGAEESLTNLKWRKANWSAGISTFALGTVLTVVQMFTSPVAALAGAANLAGYATAIAAIGILLKVTDDAIKAGEQGVTAAEVALTSAQQYQHELESLRNDAVRLVVDLQDKGLKP